MRIAGICIYSHALPVKDGPYRYSGNDLYSLDSTLSVPRVPATVTSNSSVLMLLLVCMLTSLVARKVQRTHVGDGARDGSCTTR